MISISLKNVETLVRELAADMRAKSIEEPPAGYTSQDLQHYFVQNNIFPPETFFDRKYFSVEEPGCTVTYMWLATPMEQLLEMLKKQFVDENYTVYIDIFLIDQRTPISIQVSLKNADLR